MLTFSQKKVDGELSITFSALGWECHAIRGRSGHSEVGKIDRLLARGGRLIRLDSQEILLCRDLCEQVGSNLEYTLDPLPHGIG